MNLQEAQKLQPGELVKVQSPVSGCNLALVRSVEGSGRQARVHVEFKDTGRPGAVPVGRIIKVRVP